MLLVSAPALGAQARDLLADVHFRVGGDEAQLVDLRLELGDRLLEIQEAERHGGKDALSGGERG